MVSCVGLATPCQSMCMVVSEMAILFCTHTGTTNNLLTGGVIYQNSPNDAIIICIFLSAFNGSAHCQVQYGTDPTYMNLPYSAESTETGTAGDFVSVVLRERLNSSTVYYFTVSAVSGDVTVTVRRTFTTPQYGKYICIHFSKSSHIIATHFRCVGRSHALTVSTILKLVVTYTS